MQRPRTLVKPRSRAFVVSGTVGYLLGTIPSADLATRLARSEIGSLRNAGSGNPGATNAAAVLGTRWGLAVLAADMGKGALAARVGRAIGGSTGAYFAATASVGGHIVPLWSGGRGGKGVATSAGACLAVFPAFFPIDSAVAILGATRLRNAEKATWLSSVVWIIASAVWWRRRLPNAWGPEPGAGLVGFAVGSSVMILTKFRLSRRAQ